MDKYFKKKSNYKVNILLASNSRFLEATFTLIYSLAKTQSEKLHIYFLRGKDIEKKDIIKFKKLLNSLKIDLSIIDFSQFDFPSEVREALENKKLSIEAYFRLFSIPYIQEERILWLDSDTIVQKDLKEFYHQSFNEKFLVACDSCDIEWSDALKFSLTDCTKKRLHYFNSGVLLMNLNLLRCLDFFKFEGGNLLKKLIISFYKDIEWFDQGILNLLFRFNTKYEDPLKYNCPTSWTFLSQDKSCFQHYEFLENAYIIHFAGQEKPWEENYSDPKKKEYYFKYNKELRQQFPDIFKPA